MTDIIQDAVDMEDLILYRMLRNRIDQYKDKVNKIVETSNENVHEVSEISAEQITFISSPSHPNNLEDDAGEEKNNGPARAKMCRKMIEFIEQFKKHKKWQFGSQGQ